MKKNLIIFLAILMLLPTLAGCNEKTNKSNKVQVSVSFYPLYYFAKEIGKNKITVTSLVPAGVEPHDWEPKIKDLQFISNSNVFVYNGAGMEGWVDKVVNSTNNKNLIIVDSSKGIKLLKNTNDSESKEHGANDPHIWLSIKNAKLQAKNIEKALEKADSKNKTFYKKNYSALLVKLNNLDNKFAKDLNKIKQNRIVTAHSAFAYMCKDYGLRQISIDGTFAEDGTNPKRMAEISDMCKKYKIKYIFTEELLNPRAAQVIAKQTDAKNLVLNPIESAKNGDDYISIMDKNLIVLEKDLK